MGNCQAAEAATVVIQYPAGKIERLYWPTTAQEVMKSNPGHHVALVTLCIAEEKQESGGGHVRFTRVRLLKPKDILLIGQVYRLITSQEVSKALRARKNEKIKRTQSELIKKQRQMENTRVDESKEVGHEPGNTDKAARQERDKQKSAAPSTAKARQWRPSLQSISEGGS